MQVCCFPLARSNNFIIKCAFYLGNACTHTVQKVPTQYSLLDLLISHTYT